MIKFGIFDESQEELLKKSVIFYAAISSDRINKTFDTKVIDGISKNKIKTDWWPVLRKRDDFDLDSTKSSAKEYIKDKNAYSELDSCFRTVQFL